MEISAQKKPGDEPGQQKFSDENRLPDSNNLEGEKQKDRCSSDFVAVEDGKQKKQATILAGLVGGCRLFHDSEKRGYAVIQNNQHFETLRIRSQMFKRWLSHRYYSLKKSTASTQAIQDAINSIEGRAIFDAPLETVFTRISGDDNQIIIDLGSSDWSCVVVDKDGWSIRSKSSNQFFRPKGLEPLPEPESSSEGIELFLKYLNVKPEELPLVLGWLLGALRPKGPYPALMIHGEQGSAKSTTSRICRRLIDPNLAELRSAPRTEQDLIIAANNGWLVALENLSGIKTWLSDTLCRIATGSGFATRELYENASETIFKIERPILINGIEEVATRSDLIDRSILINLPSIKHSNRKTEKEIFADFEKDKGKLFAILLDAVACSIKNLPLTKIQDPPRMADFAQWAVSGEKSFGWNGEFLKAYRGNRASANESAIESSIIGKLIIKFIQDEGTWKGTAADLLEALNKTADENTKKAVGWPKNARGISGAIRRIAPNLRQQGFEIELDGTRREIILSSDSMVDDDSLHGELHGRTNNLHGRTNNLHGTNGELHGAHGAHGTKQHDSLLNDDSLHGELHGAHGTCTVGQNEFDPIKHETLHGAHGAHGIKQIDSCKEKESEEGTHRIHMFSTVRTVQPCSDPNSKEDDHSLNGTQPGEINQEYQTVYCPKCNAEMVASEKIVDAYVTFDCPQCESIKPLKLKDVLKPRRIPR